MAKPVTKTDVEVPKPNGTSIKIVLLLSVLLALAGAGSGFALGYFTFTFGDEQAAASHAEASVPEDGAHANAAPDPHAPVEEVVKQANPARDAAQTEHASDGDPEVPAVAEAEHGGGADSTTVTLDPIVTNIAAPSSVWVRMEAVLKLSVPVAKDVTDQIHQDYITFFHTMRLQDLQGASAFIDMKAELKARANFRAEGKIKAVYIKTFLFE